MPTERKEQEVDRLADLLKECAIAISTDYTGMSVGAMTELRGAMRENDVTYRVVKNRLTYLAAEAAGKPHVRDVVQGPTGMAFGFADPVEPARALTQFIRSTRSPLKIKGGVMGERSLTAEEVAQLAALPSKDQLVARLLGQLQGPVTGLVYALNGPVSGLARVLQRRIEALGETST